VDDDIIRLIQARRTDDGFIRPGEDLTPDDRVIIDKGYLKNFTGVLEGKSDVQGRVTVLIAAVNYNWQMVVEQRRVMQDVAGHSSNTSFVKSPESSGDVRFDEPQAHPMKTRSRRVA
jgi:hypothetical protein